MDEPIRASGPYLAELVAHRLQDEGPLYRALATALKQAIDGGEIALGTVLPPERALARSLTVSRHTVVAAYERLKAEGWLDSRQGSGTWVRHPSTEPTSGVDAVSTRRLFLSEDGLEQRTGPEQQQSDREVVELSVAAVAASPTVARLLSTPDPADIELLARHHGYLPHGLLGLRQQVAARFAAQGLPTSEDQLVITTGAHQAISLIARQLLQPGDTVLVESPTFPGALDVFRRFAARTLPLPVDDQGVRPDVLADLLRRTEPRLVYLTPHFHNPTGAVLPLERRVTIAELIAAHDTVLLEDLAMGEVALEDLEPPPPIAALAPQATIHTVGSTAKLFWAGLRIGWLRSPESWSVRMLATKTVADLGSPLISQLLARRMLEHREEVLVERRAELLPRRDLLAGLLEEHLPDWDWTLPPGGLSIWAQLPHGNAEELAEVALRNGVAIVPGPALSVDEGNRRALRLVFSPPEDQLVRGIHRLAEAWGAYGRTTARSSSRLLV